MDFSIVSVDDEDLDEILFNTRVLEKFSLTQLIVLWIEIKDRIDKREECDKVKAGLYMKIKERRD